MILEKPEKTEGKEASEAGKHAHNFFPHSGDGFFFVQLFRKVERELIYFILCRLAIIKLNAGIEKQTPASS